MSKQTAKSTGLIPQITRAQVHEVEHAIEKHIDYLWEVAEGYEAVDDMDEYDSFIGRINDCNQVMRHLYERIRWQESGE